MKPSVVRVRILQTEKEVTKGSLLGIFRCRGKFNSKLIEYEEEEIGKVLPRNMGIILLNTNIPAVDLNTARTGSVDSRKIWAGLLTRTGALLPLD